MTRFQTKDLACAPLRIDEPRMVHLPGSTYWQLPDTIESRSGRGEDLTYPVRGLADVGPAGRRGHTLAPPTCNVRNEDIVTDVKLRLGDPQPPWAARAQLKRRDQAATHCGRADAVSRAGAGRGDELASEDLRYQVVGDSQEVAIGRVSPNWIHHRRRRYHDTGGAS
jgi:hypothetical protein